MQEKIKQQIEGFISKTKEHKIDWITVNAKAYRFGKTVDNRTFTVTVQEHATTPINYILTVQITNPNEVLLQIQTHQEQDYRELVKALYDGVIEANKGQNIREIDKLLDSI